MIEYDYTCFLSVIIRNAEEEVDNRIRMWHNTNNTLPDSYVTTPDFIYCMWRSVV